MKRKSFLTAALIFGGLYATAYATGVYPPPCSISPEPEVKPLDATYAPNGIANLNPRTIVGAAPASIAGMNLVTFYNSFSEYGNRAGSVRVIEHGDSVLLKGLVFGHDVMGKYDPTTGNITIPTGRHLYTTSGNVNVLFYNLLASQNFSRYNSEPVVASVDGDHLTFVDGFYAAGDGGAYVRMQNITTKRANGFMKFSQLNFSTLESVAEYDYPVYVSKTGTDEFSVQGMAQWLYSHNYNVPFSIAKNYNRATLSTGNYVDYYNSPSEGVQNYVVLFRKDSLVNSVTTNPDFTIVNGDTTKIKAQKLLYWGYMKANSKYSGYLLGGNFEITAYCDIYNSPVENLDTINGIIYQQSGANEVTVSGVTEECTELNIPATITYDGKEYEVTSIKAKAFYNNKKLTKLTMPAGIKGIGTNAFYGCTNIKDVNIMDLSAWCKVSLPGYTANPLYYAFSAKPFATLKVNGTDVGTTLTIPAGVTDIAPYTFYNLRPFKKIVLPEGLKDIGKYAFCHVDSLEKVNLPQSLEQIGSYAFYYCQSLPSINIPGSVEKVQLTCFSQCQKLTDVTLNTGLKTIEATAFAYCPLSELVLPASLDSIGANPFYNNTKMTKLTCLATTPPAVYNADVFKSFAATCDLYVPAGSVAAYQTAKAWSTFRSISSGTSGIEDLENEEENVQPVYYNMQGVRVSKPTDGIYIEVRGKKARKVVIR